MSLRAMNNAEKANAATLKKNGFNVFWFDGGPNSSGYYATHPSLSFQYHIGTTTGEALTHLNEKKSSTPINQD